MRYHYLLHPGLSAPLMLVACGGNQPAMDGAAGTPSAGQGGLASGVGRGGGAGSEPMLSPGGGGGVAGVGVTIGGAVGTAGSAGVGGSGGSTPIDQGPVNHRFLSSVAGDGPLAIVSDSGAIEWRIDIKGQANDAWLLPSGNVLYAYMSGVREVTVQKTVAWDYPAPEGSEIHGCQPLENGRYLIGETHGGGLAYLRELDSAGVVQGTVTVQAETGLGPHDQFREVRQTPQGTYLVSYMGYGKARELNG